MKMKFTKKRYKKRKRKWSNFKKISPNVKYVIKRIKNYKNKI